MHLSKKPARSANATKPLTAFVKNVLKSSVLALPATGLASFHISSRYTSRKGKIVGHGQFRYCVHKDRVKPAGKKKPVDHCRETVEDASMDTNENVYVTWWHSGRTWPVMLERITLLYKNKFAVAGVAPATFRCCW